ncbi:(2Fe-2S)-binding protein [Lacicoccus alkaliphilus]|uniref:Sarcosine oxidase subunit alpha n=1 Tax=Lacicoccus alkaliphilus DSM 16010 TaxID=1123231 RepID=A0A1M7HVU4_9BACL|nr:(2Fe-2S)-binding protein [Salinicoccus alkaliphilus]SHM32642.1 sarcosine oxidase subunit alpha [Salinicoccus alkaliphilus DSM 16010]
MTRRIIEHKILGSKKSPLIPFIWNGETYYGAEGESITAALLANDIRTLRYHERDGAPRGLYCNIGHCSECRVKVDGRENVRACLTPVRENMIIVRQGALPHLVEGGGHDGAL